MGIAGVDQASSLDILVLQDEIIGFVEHMLKPIALSDAALGLDVIADRGPGGTFIDTLHTAERFRDELWFPGLLDRQFYDAWRKEGAQDTARRCRERRDRILSSHTPEPIPADLDRDITRIVADARKHLLA
jgi:trimethylamine--corrinoid protein Co-methyltransferase